LNFQISAGYITGNSLLSNNFKGNETKWSGLELGFYWNSRTFRKFVPVEFFGGINARYVLEDMTFSYYNNNYDILWNSDMNEGRGGYEVKFSNTNRVNSNILKPMIISIELGMKFVMWGKSRY
jgi:hypothetical protein